VANTLAYYDTATITAVKSFIALAPGFYHQSSFAESQSSTCFNSRACIIKLITAVIYGFP
jgi:hypothetical protein